MNGKITLGRFIPNNTIIHKLDARLKIFAMFIMLVSIFFDLSYVEYALEVAVALLLLILSKTSLKSIFSSLKMMWFTILLLLVINIFVVKSGEVLFSLGKLEIYSGSFTQTAMIFVRLFLMICYTTVLTTTTSPLELTNAIEWYFNPLKVIKFPAHEIAMTISIALRFIPTLLEETERLIKAQSSRGVDLKNGSIKEKINGVVSLIVPLFVSSFQRSEELADAMEARGYDPTKKRTKYRQLKFKWIDLFALLLSISFVTLIIFSSYRPALLGVLRIW